MNSAQGCVQQDGMLWGATEHLQEVWGALQGWKGPVEITQSNPPLPKGLECSQRGRLHTLPGQLFQCSASLKVKKFFLKVW